jgi:hypothetical protein
MRSPRASGKEWRSARDERYSPADAPVNRPFG